MVYDDRWHVYEKVHSFALLLSFAPFAKRKAAFGKIHVRFLFVCAFTFFAFLFLLSLARFGGGKTIISRHSNIFSRRKDNLQLRCLVLWHDCGAR